jgi:hypothetical protein
LKGKIEFEVSNSIRVYWGRLGCEVVEISVQPDHVTSDCENSSENIDISIDGNDEGENGVTGIQEISVSKRKTLLG